MTPSFLNPTTDLFVRTATLEPGERVLLLHSDDPALAQWAVERVGANGLVMALHTAYWALKRLARVPGLVVSEVVYPDARNDGPIHTALLDLPKGRDVARAYLATAADVLVAGGSLYLAGSNAVGAKSAIKDAADLYDEVTLLGYKASRRIARATLAGSARPVPFDWGAPWKPQMRSIQHLRGSCSIITMPGVFSWDHLDDGTALLLDHLGVEPGMTVLDMGCGYGIIGLMAARAGAQVTMVDVDLLAVRCARASVIANNLEAHCEVLASDVTEAIRDRQFDLVLSNPPFHQGVDVTTDIAGQIIRDARDVLCPGGRLRIVANRFLPYPHDMQAAYGNVRTLAQTGRYVVVESVWEG